MFTPRQLLSTILTIAILCGSAAAQAAANAQSSTNAPSSTDTQTTNAQSSLASAPAVTASASGAGARFASPGEVLQMRLQIYSAAGELVFDSGARAGGVIDWKLADVQQGLADGAYLCVVTVKDLRNRATQKLSAMSVASGRVSLAVAREDELTAAQAKSVSAARQALKVNATEAAGAATVMREGKERAVTVASHDGQVGQVTSTSGALTFRTGDFFSGAEREQMRITADGRVGIGTTDPQATLDVAGTVRARGGIVFDDGTVLKSARGEGARGAAAVVGGTVVPAAAGTGTADKLAKWIDNAGTLGDSAISETGGRLGIGTTNPVTSLSIGGSTKATPMTTNFQYFSPNSVIDQGIVGWNYYWNGSAMVRQSTSFTGIRFGANPASTNEFSSFFVTMANLSGTDHTVITGSLDATGAIGLLNANHRLAVGAGDSTAFTPLSSVGVKGNMAVGTNYAQTAAPTNGAIIEGNVGVGTTNPSQKLEVAGSLKLSGAGNALIFPDGSSMTTAAGGGGSTPSGTSIVNAINDPSTAVTINDNRVSANLARLNGANAWAGTNVFSLGLSANSAQITNVGNPVNAGDAVNKFYFDANAVRLTPAAPQVSVGDANGTAAMLNLRGGSTCCSGPGGFTPGDFKVFQNGSFLATGNLGIGVSPMEGKGYRTSWYTYKGAFRSGYADNEWDDANTGFFSWAGGSNSTASGLYSFSFGDTNFAESTSSIVFGSGNQVKGAAGFSAGAGNRVCDTYGVAFGNKAQSGGPLINGRCDPDSFNITGLAAVAIGYNVTADKDHTTALGKFASNNGFSGTFVWSDGSATASADTFKNTANNEFAARATGGFRFRTNLTGTTGCNLPAGSGVFNCTSSRTTKENFLNVQGEDVLARVRKLPVSTWNYIDEGRQVRHMGPMAEDFYKSFGLGTNNISIGVQDLAGVSLAAVKALDARTTNLQQTNAQLNAKLQEKTAEVAQLRAQLNGMEQRLAALERSNAQTQPHTAKRTRATRR
jgi:uncharacterized coiled-coil protein SlyX